MAAQNPRLAIEVSVEGLSKASKDFGTLQKQLKSVDTEFRKANSTVLELERELNSLKKSFSSGSISQSQYSKSSKEISVALSSARQAAQTYDARIRSLNATIAQGANAGRSYGDAMGRLQGVHNSVASGIRGSSTVALEFSRIIQDAPYGIQGVANNIQQLTTNLGFYTKNLREAYAAQGRQVTGMALFRGVLSGLLSPISLLTLGISAVTSGFVLYEKWQQRSKKSTEDTKKSLTEYIDSLSGVARAMANGQVEAQKELVSVDQLYKATQNLNLPMKDRLEYARELIKTGGDVFESTSAEAIVAGKAADQYDRLARNIQASAIAQANMQRMTENATRILSNNLNVLNEANEIMRLNREIARQESITPIGQAVGEGAEAAERGRIDRLRKLEQERLERIKAINNANSENAGILQEQSLLQGNINEQLENGGTLVKSTVTGLNGIKDTAKEIASITNGVLRDSLNYYDAKLFDIQAKYDNIYAKIDDPDILGLAKQNEEAEKLRVSLERTDKILQDIGKRTAGVSITGGSATVPVDLPNLAQTVQRINATNAANLDDPFSKQMQSTLRRGLARTFDNLFSDISSLSQSNYDIERKYAELRENASADQIQALQKMEVLEKRINSGLESMMSKIASGFTSIGSNLLSSALSTGISSGDFSDLTKMFTGKNKWMGIGAAGSLVGGALSNIIPQTSGVGQGLSGALSGAGSGAAIGSVIPGIGTVVGAIGGALIGALSGIFGSSRRRRQEELAELQLKEQRKLVALQERQAALAYSSSIIGQQTNAGIVTSIDRDSFGNLVATVKGQDIQLALDRYNNNRG